MNVGFNAFRVLVILISIDLLRDNLTNESNQVRLFWFLDLILSEINYDVWYCILDFNIIIYWRVVGVSQTFKLHTQGHPEFSTSIRGSHNRLSGSNQQHRTESVSPVILASCYWCLTTRTATCLKDCTHRRAV